MLFDPRQPNTLYAGLGDRSHAIRRAHVSGHASQEELKLMLSLIRPRYFVPVHGEFRHLLQHARLAEAHASGWFGMGTQGVSD